MSRVLAGLLTGALVAAGLGLVDAGPAAAVDVPTIQAASTTPREMAFTSTAAIRATGVITVEEPAAGSGWVYRTAFVADNGCAPEGAETVPPACPRWLQDEFSEKVPGQDVRTIRLSGAVPNERFDGSLNRSPDQGSVLRVQYTDPAGDTVYVEGGTAFNIQMATRIRTSAPVRVETGQNLVVGAVVEQFTRSWVPLDTGAERPLVLQSKPSGATAFHDIATATTGADGTAEFLVRGVAPADTGLWRVVLRTDMEAYNSATSPVFPVTVATSVPPVTTPSEPILTLRKVTGRTATVNWAAPVQPRGPISAYRWSWTGGGRTWARRYPVGDPNLDDPFTLTGLRPRTRYVVRLRAFNANGGGALATLVVRTPTAAALPSAPRSVRGRVGNHRAVLTWRAPARGRVHHYRVHRYGARDHVLPARARLYVFKGLRNDATYTLYVQAHTAGGWGPRSRGVAVRPHR